MTVEISGLRIVRFPKMGHSGYTVVAYFNCTANGIGMDGCCLMHRRGTINIAPPQIMDETKRKRIVIVDPELRAEIQGSILLAYRGLGGKMPGDDGEIPQQDQAPVAVVSLEKDEGLARFMQGAA